VIIHGFIGCIGTMFWDLSYGLVNCEVRLWAKLYTIK
jgi:hypothetical protein